METIPTVEQIVDQLCKDLDNANAIQDFETANKISQKIANLLEEMRADIIQVRTIH